MLKSKCPPYGRACNKCGKANHFSTCCLTSKKPARKVNAMGHDTGHQEGDTADTYVYHVHDSNYNLSTIYAKMLVSGKAVKFQRDTGAAVNVLPRSILAPGTKVKPSSKILKTYDGSTLSTKGTAKVMQPYQPSDAVTPRNHL